MSEKHVTAKNKEETKQIRTIKNTKTKCSYLLPERFEDFPWAQWIDMPFADDKSPLDSSGHFPSGKLFCGICSKAIENGCKLVKETEKERKRWVKGISSWHNYGDEKTFREHSKSDCHKTCTEWLENWRTKDVRKKLQDEQARSKRVHYQTANRHYFCIVQKAVLHLASMGDALYGNDTKSGKLVRTLKLMANQTPHMEKYLSQHRKHDFIAQCTHSDNVNFILKEFTDQILAEQFSKIKRCTYGCIIADEWSTMLSSSEYVSVSIQCAFEDLTVETIFLGFYSLENTTADEVTKKILLALKFKDEEIDFDKIIGQTYDGASNMQGVRSGVQQQIRSTKCYFALSNHCWNHQVQLSVKKEANGHILIQNTISYCGIIVKLFKYSPKRAEMLKKVKIELIESNTSAFPTTAGKVLGFCITRWTCRKESLVRIFEGYHAQFMAFVIMLTDRNEYQRLDSEHKTDVIAMIAQKQKFEFLFGLKLSIAMFTVVETPTTQLQQKSLSASEGINIVRDLIKELKEQMSDDAFENVWKETMEAREKFNTAIADDERCCRLGYVDHLEEPKAP